MSKLVWDLGLGAAIGYGASRVMDLTTGWFFEHQSEASRRREVEVAPGGTPVVVGKKLAALVRAGDRPFQAGIVTGTTAFLLVDEGLSSAAFAPR